MALAGCYSCIKYLMFAFNFLFWLVGCAILGLGIWMRVDENVKNTLSLASLSNSSMGIYTAAYILIVVGAITMILGFLGCCGAIKESQCMLVTFFIFLLIIFAVLLAAGIWAIVSKKELLGNLEKAWEKEVNNYYSNSNATRELVDAVQKKFKCCGVKGKSDYGDHRIPESCSREDDKTKYYEQGCYQPIYDFLAEHMVMIAGVAIGIAVVMLIGMIFSMVLCCAIRETAA